MPKLYLLCALLLTTAGLRGDHPPSAMEEIPSDLPWLTGPLLCPSAHVIPSGHLNFEPYLFGTSVIGIYNAAWHTQSIPNFYSISSINPIQYGLPAHLDFQVVPQFSWNHTEGASQWVINDLPLIFDVQLATDEPHHWWPAAKLTMGVSIPIGKYQKLDAKKLGTDAGGAGTWNETVGLVFSKLFRFSPVQFLSSRFFCGYTFPNPVHVKGLNVYGGGPGTSGKAYPGNTLTTILGLEYTPTPHWALACDFEYQHQNKSRFSGKTVAPMTSPSSEQFSVAPAFEYNWNAYVGLISGVWFSFAGRNASQFVSGVVAVNIYW